MIKTVTCIITVTGKASKEHKTKSTKYCQVNKYKEDENKSYLNITFFH